MEALIPIVCILAGLLLIAVEVYLIPGFNVIGILGAMLIIFAVGYAYSESGIFGGTIALSGTLASGILLFMMLWRSGAWDRFILSTTLKTEADAASRRSDARAQYLGKAGVAITPLRPTGIAEIDGQRVEVSTEGEFIAVGSKIRIVAMDRRRFFARLETA
ncbi:MAG: hypothetical protein OXE92_10160 [Bacteroidetes bacterium]|nr:hypothetical protein [Bacteroidota bacterium]MCY4206072.1 hypothetical protein [Bacteroidota bacterium]